MMMIAQKRNGSNVTNARFLRPETFVLSVTKYEDTPKLKIKVASKLKSTKKWRRRAIWKKRTAKSWTPLRMRQVLNKYFFKEVHFVWFLYMCI